MAKKTIVEFELVDHGIEHSGYFQGCGTSFTRFEDVATGIGMNPAEAIDDCLEQLAMRDWDCEGMEKRILAQELPGKRVLPKKPAVPARSEAYYHISIRVLGPAVEMRSEYA